MLSFGVFRIPISQFKGKNCDFGHLDKKMQLIGEGKKSNFGGLDQITLPTVCNQPYRSYNSWTSCTKRW